MEDRQSSSGLAAPGALERLRRALASFLPDQASEDTALDGARAEALRLWQDAEHLDEGRRAEAHERVRRQLEALAMRDNAQPEDWQNWALSMRIGMPPTNLPSLRERIDASLEILDRGLAKAADDRARAQLLTQRGQTRAALEEPEGEREARADFHAALRLQPTHSVALAGLAMMLETSAERGAPEAQLAVWCNELDTSIEAALASSESAADTVRLAQGRAALNLAWGQRDKDALARCLAVAVHEYARVCGVQPNNAQARVTWASTVRMQAELAADAEAVTWLRQASLAVSDSAERAPASAAEELWEERRYLEVALADRVIPAERAGCLRRACADCERQVAAGSEDASVWDAWAELHTLLAEESPREAAYASFADADRVLELGLASFDQPADRAMLLNRRGMVALAWAVRSGRAQRERRLHDCERYLDAATRLDPLHHFAWRNRSLGLRQRAEDQPTQDLSRALVAQAAQLVDENSARFASGVAHTYMLEGAASAYVALAAQCTAQKRARYHALAVARYEQATSVDATQFRPWLSWAGLLCQQAHTALREEARAKHRKARELLERGLSVARDAQARRELLHQLARVEHSEGERTTDPEREPLLESAARHYAEAADGNEGAWSDWAGAQAARALTASSERAQGLLEASRAELEQRLAKPSRPAVRAQLLCARAALREALAVQHPANDERDAILRDACSDYEQGHALLPTDTRLLTQWSRALAKRAALEGATALELYRACMEKTLLAIELRSVDGRREAFVELCYNLHGLGQIDPLGGEPLVARMVALCGVLLDEDPAKAAVYHFEIGNLLREFGQLEEAKQAFGKGRDCINAPIDALFCQHNLSDVLATQGLALQAAQEWHRTNKMYERVAAEAGDELNPNVCGYWAGLLFDVFGRAEQADALLRSAIAFGHTPSRSTWVARVDIAKECAETEGRSTSVMIDLAKQAERVFRVAPFEPAEREFAFGQIAVLTGDYAQAELRLRRALEFNPANLDAYAALGSACFKQRKYDEAQRAFEQLQRRAPRDLGAPAQLAQIMVKCGDSEGAEQLYRQVLDACPQHVDALLGLADLAISQADESGDPEGYEHGIENLSTVLRLAGRGQGLRRMRSKERAQAYYSRGYARVKLGRLGGKLSAARQLDDAVDDFRRAAKLDPTHIKAQRALKRTADASRTPATRRLQAVGSLATCLLALVLFGICQFSYWVRWDATAWLRPIESASYFGVSFAALAFFVVGLYLPELLRLKVAGIELERSPLELAERSPINLTR